MKMIFLYKTTLWHRGVVVITTAQLHSTKPELRFCAGSNPARRAGYSRWWGSLTMVRAGNKAKRLSSVDHTTKTIHHLHHHHQSKAERKSKLQNGLIVNSWINISLLQNHPATGYKIEIFEWKNNNWVKLLKGFNIKMKSLNKNRNIKYK